MEKIDIKLWNGFVYSFKSDEPEPWHEATGDIWGGIMAGYKNCGRYHYQSVVPNRN
jgi:hypothetical protein